MLVAIRKLFTGNNGAGRESEGDREQKKYVAAGVLLLEAAHIDDDCSAAELTHIVETLRGKFGLSEQFVAELLELAHRGREQAVDLWQFTNHLNQDFSLAEKLTLLEDVWRIILVDGQLDKHEDHFAHKLANLLRLSHHQLIEAKLRAREKMTGKAQPE
jgi:uncharacterized tellurite resistance protein B-like protein